MNSPHQPISVVCIGAGPACLSAAHKLSEAGISVVLLEQNKKRVGGISRTERYRGYGIDIGGHRFFSKSPEVNRFWQRILGKDFLLRKRKSRIFYRKKFFSYPLNPLEAFLKLGPWTSLLCGLSFLSTKFFPMKRIRSFEDWVSQHFGKKLYQIFFKTYTEKVWGIKCSEISSEWAAQRIKGLSLLRLVFSPLLRVFKRVPKSMISEFHYPRLGPGLMWEKVRDEIREMGGKTILDAKVVRVEKINTGWEVTYQEADGREKILFCDEVISSTSLKELCSEILVTDDLELKTAARNLKYRDFLIVALILDSKVELEDNWLYIHDPEVKVGRIQNFSAWSPAMAPDCTSSCLGLEYFCNFGEELWNLRDDQLIELAKSELQKLNILSGEKVVDGHVVRQLKAYPVYDESYKENVSLIREKLAKDFVGLHTIGRNGLHKYNNQDHSMMTGFLAAQNIIQKKKEFDVWQVNIDAAYHESTSGERSVPPTLS